MNSVRKKEGMTMIDIMIAVIVLGILATMSWPNYEKAARKSQWVDAVAVMNTLYKAVRNYYMINSAWPPDQTFNWVDANCNDVNTYLKNIGFPVEVPLKGCDKFTYDIYCGGPNVCAPPNDQCAIFAFRRDLCMNPNWGGAGIGGTYCWGMKQDLITGAIETADSTVNYP